MAMTKRRSVLSSLVIIFCALALATAPIPALKQQITVVAGSELQQILPVLKQQFAQSHPEIKVDLLFQGSQDIVNNFIDQKFDTPPTVLIPADAELLDELQERWRSQNQGEPFYEQPQPLAKTLLVGIAWPEGEKFCSPKTNLIGNGWRKP
jgi:ABC-type molybdate transport system substrate-binding protein